VLAATSSVTTATATNYKDKNYYPAAVITKTETTATSIFWHKKPPFRRTILTKVNL